MKRFSGCLSFIVLSIVLALIAIVYSVLSMGPVVITYPDDASWQERFAAREIRRYLYMRTGRLPEILRESRFVSPFTDVVSVSVNSFEAVKKLMDRDENFGETVDELEPGQYAIATRPGRFKTRYYCIGGDETGTLYAAYRFCEHLGVRYFLHGDVVPDTLTTFDFPVIDESGKPLFETRGILPYHDFPEGPDWWNRDDYLAVIGQLPKMRMNFFSLHTYPEGAPNAEPTVWIGTSSDIGSGDEVHHSYPASYQNTLRGNWGYTPKHTGSWSFGGSLLFDRDDYGNDVMTGYIPRPESPEGSNEVFRRAGEVLGDAFDMAHTLGIATCIGTETPMIVPEQVAARLRDSGRDPADSSTVYDLYLGLFRRVSQATPIDYYWFWTPEGWTWGGNTRADLRNTMRDLGAAISAIETAGKHFELATCGWVLGPRSDRAMFDEFLPKRMPMSCINRLVGAAPVDRAFSRVSGRPKWAIPWLEDDPGLTSPQLWVGRMRKDASDALRYGCTGLMGIHWRTRLLGPNADALAKAAWDMEPWQEENPPSGALTGSVAAPVDHAIANTDEPDIYQTSRTNVFNYRFTVPNGNCRVTLKFCETEIFKRGQRVFDVIIQDEKVLSRLDVYERAGGYRAYDRVFEDIAVTDGFLEINFEPWEGPAAICGIIVEHSGGTEKINCGGPALGGYEADTLDQWERLPARHAPSGDYYRTWARDMFGPEASDEITAVFERMDGQMPRASDWVGGPGGWKPDTASWDERSRDYTFVEDLEYLEDRVKGPGNRARFDYWLESFRFMRSSARLCCTWGEFSREMDEIRDIKDSDTKATEARNRALPLYIEMIDQLSETYAHLLASVSTTGGLGTVANVEQHIMPSLIGATGEELAGFIGEPLGGLAAPDAAYTGSPRLIVTTGRTALRDGEDLFLRVIVLDNDPPAEASLNWRPLGKGEYTAVPLTHTARGVHTVTLTAEDISGRDIEYYITAVTAGGANLVYPPTAPDIAHTVVVMETGPSTMEQ